MAFNRRARTVLYERKYGKERVDNIEKHPVASGDTVGKGG